MTEEQKRFLHFCVVEPTDYDTISNTLGVPRKTLSQWYDDDEQKQERLKIAAIRTLWIRKEIKIPFIDFYQWYSNHERKCFYCDITEAQIAELIAKENLKTKRLPTRGRKLELDRRRPDERYDDLDNLVFACYWCNNAKTDTFTDEEFKKVGEVFKDIWRKRMEA